MTRNDNGDENEPNDELQGTPGIEEPDEELRVPVWRTPDENVVERTKETVEIAVMSVVLYV